MVATCSVASAAKWTIRFKAMEDVRIKLSFGLFHEYIFVP